MKLMEFEVALEACQTDNRKFSSRGFNPFALAKLCMTRRFKAIISQDSK
jgi:hypothetical protein